MWGLVCVCFDTFVHMGEVDEPEETVELETQ